MTYLDPYGPIIDKPWCPCFRLLVCLPCEVDLPIIEHVANLCDNFLRFDFSTYHSPAPRLEKRPSSAAFKVPRRDFWISEKEFNFYAIWMPTHPLFFWQTNDITRVGTLSSLTAPCWWFCRVVLDVFCPTDLGDERVMWKTILQDISCSSWMEPSDKLGYVLGTVFTYTYIREYIHIYRYIFIYVCVHREQNVSRGFWLAPTTLETQNLGPAMDLLESDFEDHVFSTIYFENQVARTFADLHLIERDTVLAP